MFVLVEFDNNDIDIIPSRWLKTTGQAYWPNNMRPSKVSNAVLTKCAPCNDWKIYKVKELYRNESYSIVRQKLRRAEAYTDIASTEYSESDEEDVTRKSKRKRISKTFSSDSEVDSALTPQKNRQRKLVEKSVQLPIPPSPRLLQSGSFGQKRTLSVAEANSATEKRSTCTPKQTSLIEDLSQSDVQEQEIISNQEISTSSTLETQPSVSDISSQQVLLSSPRTQTPRCENVLNPMSSHQARDLRIFTLLEQIKQEQGDMKDQLCEILGVLKNRASSDMELTLPENLKFPLQSVEEVEELELALQDTSVFNGLIGFLSCLGGRSRPDATRRVMKKIFSHKLSCEDYTWYGRKGKRPFGKLKLACVVQKSIQKSFKTSLTEVEMDVREWFRTASDRDGGRKKRQKSKEVNQNSTEELAFTLDS
ncbi:hypothetical protein ACF0H5_001232 [Mactra antiquata]